MRFVLPILLFALIGVSAPAASPASGSIALDDDVEARWVPFQITAGNQIRFALDINGQSATAILDTGVSHSVVSPDFARRAGLRVSRGGTARAIGGDVAIGWAASPTVRFGGLSRSGGNFAVVALPASATGNGTPVDAMIGADILSCCALDIDYDSQQFRLLRSGRLPFAGERVPLRLTSGTNMYLAESTIAGQPVRAMLVDTGDGAAMTLTEATWGKIAPHGQPVTTTLAYGVGGPVTTGLTIVPAIGLGPVTADNVEVRIEDRGAFLSRAGVSGRIGTGLMQRYRVLLDPRAGTMVLAPGRGAGAAPVRSTSGLLLARTGQTLQVLHVMQNSPAAQGGWRVGETICAVDDRPVASDAGVSAALTRLIAAPGQTVAFSLCNGARRQLVLQRFY